MSPRKRRKIKGPKFLKGLSVPPGDLWPQGVLHHGARVFLLLALAVTIVILLPPDPRPTVTPYEVGEVAQDNITADVAFPVMKSQDELTLEQEAYESTVPAIFTRNTEVIDSTEAGGRRFFDRIEEVADTGTRGELEAVVREMGIVAIDSAQVDLLFDASNRRLLRTAFDEVTRELLPLYIDASSRPQIRSGDIELREGSGVPRLIPVDSLLVGEDFLTPAFGRIRPADRDLSDLFSLIGFRFFRAPISLEINATTLARRDARMSVDPVKVEIQPGQAIIRVGDLITETKLRELNAYQDALGSRDPSQQEGTDWVLVLGTGLLALILLGIFGLLLYFFRPEVYGNFRWVLLLVFLVLAYFGAAAVLSRLDAAVELSWLGFPSHLLPIAFTVLPVAILWDGRMALILALLLSVLTGGLTPYDQYSVLTITLLGGAAAALSARAVRRRSQTWIFIALITMAYSLATLAAGLMEGTEPRQVLISIGLAAGNATVSAILAMGFITVFEWFTGITTDQTLLEWADPNRSLLKSLSLEASGTYAHTINVANLGEAAATAIGANGLLCRVGIYYHDVGKILKPQYFVENQPGGRNPHDKLKPQTSASIVREHVLEGEKMAREEGVPDVVARFIPEHHGTQLIGFFYQKAKEESDEEPDPEEFRYPGPKPQSKETAISMLADSVESATRALKDPSPDRVRELVRTVVEGKIRDEQLSEAPLTLREISIIQDQFVKVVSGMFHQRIDYPETKHLTESEAVGEDEAPGEQLPRASTEETPSDPEGNVG